MKITVEGEHDIATTWDINEASEIVHSAIMKLCTAIGHVQKIVCVADVKKGTRIVTMHITREVYRGKS